MKLLTLLSARKAIMQHVDDKLPSALAYKLMKLLKATDAEEDFYNEKCKDAIEKFADRDDSGKIRTKDGNVIISKSQIEEFNSAIKEVQDVDVEVPNIRFNISELACVNLTIVEVSALDGFIDA